MRPICSTIWCVFCCYLVTSLRYSQNVTYLGAQFWKKSFFLSFLRRLIFILWNFKSFIQSEAFVFVFFVLKIWILFECSWSNNFDESEKSIVSCIQQNKFFNGTTANQRFEVHKQWTCSQKLIPWRILKFQTEIHMKWNINFICILEHWRKRLIYGLLICPSFCCFIDYQTLYPKLWEPTMEMEEYLCVSTR